MSSTVTRSPVPDKNGENAVKPVSSDPDLNGDFGLGYPWDGVVVDKVAVASQIKSGTLIRLQ
jgi:hypothetical protein